MCVVANIDDANDVANRVRRGGLQQCVPFLGECLVDTLGKCRTYELHRAERVESRLGRTTRRPTNPWSQNYPKNAHATSNEATTIADTTNQMSVVRATRLRVGLNPMSPSIAATCRMKQPDDD